MENNKKKKINVTAIVIIIAILIICLVGGLIAVLFLTDCDNTQQKKLAGKELQTGIYKYDLIEPDSFHESFIKDDYIYYLVTYEDKFEYYKKNIYTNEDSLIGTIKNEDNYCYTSNEHIKCTSENNFKLYDYNLKTIYDGENNVIIPYKDSYIEIKDNKIYLNNKEYKTLPGDYSDYDVYEYNEFDNNLYLSFGRAYTNEQCLYNLEKNKCEEYDYKGIKDYSNGYYYYDDEKIHVTNSQGDVIKEYNNILGNDINYSTALSNNLLYNYSDYYIKIYNLDNGKVSLIDYLFDTYIERIELDNNLLSLIEGSEVYIINLDEIESKEITIDELKEFFNNKLQEKIELIKNDYSVEVAIKEDADLKFDSWNQTIKGEREYSDLSKSLDKTINLLKDFGPEFFKSFIHDEWKGLKIYIAEDIESGDTFDYDGEAFRYYDYYSIILTTNDYTRTLSHELMHTLEDRINNLGNTSFPDWSKYNPKGYMYATKYNQYGSTYKYTVGYGTGDYYFLDNYSQTNELEDRARIFENIYMDTTTDIIDNQYIFNKAKYQVSEIIKYYPMIADMKMFEPFKA